MKKISLKGNKLTLENNVTIFVTKQMIADFSLKSAKTLSDTDYIELMKRRILVTAYDMLAKRDYSIREFIDKLTLKFKEKKLVKEIADDFLEKGYLDDYRFGISYANSHKYGIKKLEYIFKLNGIDSSIIKDILLEIRDSQLEEIREQILKMASKEKDKQIASLMRKGYDYGDIKKVLSELES